ncbi:MULTISPECIES: MMPL family transporter [Actinomadura]|jgi:RND superfamily putative drug exporter|uniref:RND superfamily putative drug exporter n=1 Tax=Actinomadura citrea TaxID=46158 RepID=A0A7Y9G848_9ACTN|nr:MMPL family transporter [Actinomadura citrea]NYE11657.1 RND superfamily putative drug exporter [Actinomadura citrea]GGT86746.1 membrane protein [Actinomadura citrea]
MFDRWGRWVHRRRRWVLAAAGAALVFAAVWGTGVFGALTSSGGFDTPGSQSATAERIAERDLGRGAADVVVLYQGGTTVDDPAFRASVERALAALPPGKVAKAVTYWTTGAPQFVSDDRKATYAVLQLAGSDEAAREDAYTAIQDDLTEVGGGLTAKVGGAVGTEVAINERVSSDIGRAEGMAMPVLLVLLVLIFGGLVAASLPLLVGGLAVLGSFTALHALSYVTDVSIFAVNITTFLGLGLAIDYGLFMVSRFREEIGRDGASAEDALAATMATAGRTVAVSGVTVAVSLSGLLLFDQNFLVSMGYGGIATVLVCMAGALTVLPALMAVLGPKVNALPIRRRRAASGGRFDGWWGRVARSVMRRPVVYMVATVALLLALGAPLLHINWGGVDARALPDGADARVVSETLETRFPRNATSPIEAVVTGTSDRAAVQAYGARLDALPGVTDATVTGAGGTTTRIALRYDADPNSGAARDLVQHVRDVPPPPGARAYVGGETADVVDQLASIGATLPWLALLVGGATFVLLFLAFGSVLLPLKAIVMNMLSLSATFGAVVLVFQDGHLSGPLGFTATGAISPAMPILMLAMLFGISMDYEVFLLSRVREQYDLTGSNTAAVASGVQRTGAIITSAALLFIVVIGAFATSGITFIKMTGVGMAVAILLDATVVRALLVPATMRLLGRANWWAPGPLARLYGRYGIREGDAPAAPPARLEPVG